MGAEQNTWTCCNRWGVQHGWERRQMNIKSCQKTWRGIWVASPTYKVIFHMTLKEVQPSGMDSSGCRSAEGSCKHHSESLASGHHYLDWYMLHTANCLQFEESCRFKACCTHVPSRSSVKSFLQNDLHNVFLKDLAETVCRFSWWWLFRWCLSLHVVKICSDISNEHTTSIFRVTEYCK